LDLGLNRCAEDQDQQAKNASITEDHDDHGLALL
jgi:hypothetical protein